jgi:peptidoglycan/LPS O-acetylase OafA/YrhL
MKRNQSLDVLRCVAILLVIGRHFPYYPAWAKIGWIGVDLFFVLSGFLISGLLFVEYKTHGRIRFWRFVVRRGFKIWPSFYLMVGAFVAISLIFHEDNWHAIVASLFFVQNYLPESLLPTIVGHTWSLAIEEHFYIALPLLFIALSYNRRREPFTPIPVIFVLTTITCLALRCFTMAPGDTPWGTQLRVDSLFAGVMLGYLYHFRRTSFDRLTGNFALPIAAMCCLPAAFFNVQSRIMETVGLTALYIGFSFLLAWSVVRAPTNRVAQAFLAPLAKIGFYSYSIYLWHTFIGRAVEISSPSFGFGAFWLYVGLCIGIGIVLSKTVEHPYLALREKWFRTEN